MKAAVRSLVATALACAAAACADPAVSPAAVTRNATPAELLAQVCSKCHGINGVSTSPKFPRLAGQQPDYIVAQLLNFRDRSRTDPLAEAYMWEVARNLSDPQIQGLAELLGSQPVPRNAAGDEAIMAAGRKIYFEGIDHKGVPACMMCHGPNGEGFGAFPRLAQQHQDYMIQQLRVFRSGRGRPHTPMAVIAPNLSETEMFAVTAYLQGMPSAK